MTRWSYQTSALVVVSLIFFGCDKGPDESRSHGRQSEKTGNTPSVVFEKQVAELTKELNLSRRAKTTVGSDSIEFWMPLDENNWLSHPVLIVGRDALNSIRNFTRIRLGTLPLKCFGTDRFFAIEAVSENRAERGVVVYDGQRGAFAFHALSEHVDSLIIKDAALYFSSCKTQSPLWRLDLQSGVLFDYHRPEMQGVRFFIRNDRVTTWSGTSAFVLHPDHLEMTGHDLSDADPTSLRFSDLLISE